MSELFTAWQVCRVLSTAEYLLLPTVSTTMEPKKLIREETVHAQLSKMVSGLKWILFWDIYQNSIDFTHVWPLQLSQTLSGTQLLLHIRCYVCRINTQHYDAQISLPLLTAHAHGPVCIHDTDLRIMNVKRSIAILQQIFCATIRNSYLQYDKR